MSAEDKFDFSSLERLTPSAPPPKEPTRWGARIAGTLAFFVAAAIVVAVPWYFLARPAEEPPRGTPSPSPSPSPSVSASPSPPPVAGTYEVTGVDGECLRVRVAPGLTKELLDCIGAGVLVTSDGKTAEADGRTWLHIRDPFANADGWAAAEFLRKVQ